MNTVSISVKDVPEVLDALNKARDLKARHEYLHKLYAAAKGERDTLRKERASTIVCMFVGMIGMFLFGVWLAGKANSPGQPRCVLSVDPKPLENAPKVAGVEVWL